jgi:hypothetical protein
MARSPLLTEAQVVEQLGIAIDTLRGWRYDRRPGLPYVKLGAAQNAAVRYKQVDVDRYIDACQVTP